MPEPNAQIGMEQAAPAPVQTPQGSAVPPVVKVKIDKDEKELPLSEVIKLAEKAGGADKRFQEAAAERQKNADAWDMYQLYNKVKDGTQLSLPEQTRYSELLGMPLEAFQAQYRPAATPAPAQTPAPAAHEDEDDDDVRGASVPPELVQMLQDVTRKVNALWDDNVQNQTQNIVEKAIGNDETLQGILELLPGDTERGEVIEYIRSSVNERAVQRASTGRPFGPRDAAAAVSAVASVLKRVGTSQATKRSTNLMQSNLGALGSGLPDISQPEPQRVTAANQAEYSRNFGSRLAHRIAKRMLGDEPK